MGDNPHFASAPSWDAARELLVFQPLKPAFTGGRELQSLRIYVRDHKMRELPIGERTLEAHYGTFVISQAHKGVSEARRLALEVSYGGDPREASIAACAARAYELGPEPEPGDPDGRPPSVVTWHDAGMFLLVASGELPVAELIPIAASMYSARSG